MSKSDRPASTRARSAKPAFAAIAGKAHSVNTDSGPAVLSLNPFNSAASEKMVLTEALVAAMPYNPTKAGEHGFDQGLTPQVGALVDAASRLPGGSTLTEENGTEKTGSIAPEGVNATIEPLDRVRVDSAGQVLTTNEGVAISDNQNSLKFGLRGPALLEDL